MKKDLYIIKDYHYYDSYCDSETIYDDYKVAHDCLTLINDENYHLQTYRYNEDTKSYFCISDETINGVVENEDDYKE